MNIKCSPNEFQMNPKYIPIDKIIYYAKVDKDSISYDYIYKMTQYQTMNNSIAKRKILIEDLIKELVKLQGKWNNFKGDSLWLDELSKLKKIITNGIKTCWKFNEPEVIYQ